MEAGERRRRFSDRVFIALFFTSLYVLHQSWRQKLAGGRAINPSDIAAVVSLAASIIYLAYSFYAVYFQFPVDDDGIKDDDDRMPAIHPHRD